MNSLLKHHDLNAMLFEKRIPVRTSNNTHEQLHYSQKEKKVTGTHCTTSKLTLMKETIQPLKVSILKSKTKRSYHRKLKKQKGINTYKKDTQKLEHGKMPKKYYDHIVYSPKNKGIDDKHEMLILPLKTKDKKTKHNLQNELRNKSKYNSYNEISKNKQEIKKSSALQWKLLKFSVKLVEEDKSKIYNSFKQLNGKKESSLKVYLKDCIPIYNSLNNYSLIMNSGVVKQNYNKLGTRNNIERFLKFQPIVITSRLKINYSLNLEKDEFRLEDTSSVFTSMNNSSQETQYVYLKVTDVNANDFEHVVFPELCQEPPTRINNIHIDETDDRVEVCSQDHPLYLSQGIVDIKMSVQFSEDENNVHGSCQILDPFSNISENSEINEQKFNIGKNEDWSITQTWNLYDEEIDIKDEFNMQLENVEPSL